jgi:hypothetical protein
MFSPNTTGKLYTRGPTNIYDEATYSQPRMVACTIVSLQSVIKATAIRTDASASRSNAEETNELGTILFPLNAAIKVDDKFEISGLTLRITGIQPRYDIFGQPDHQEAKLGILPNGL